MRLHSSPAAPLFLLSPHPHLALTGVCLAFLCMPFLFLIPLLSKNIYAFPLCLFIQLIPDPSHLF